MNTFIISGRVNERFPSSPHKGETYEADYVVCRPIAVTILIGSGTFAVDLQAQNDLPMTVRIPFPFIMDSHSIAPGTYQFSLVSGQFLPRLKVINRRAVTICWLSTGNHEKMPRRATAAIGSRAGSWIT
ncbi:MAG TPA: hypothetical protein VHZ09_08880 [Acidobacteriaceae bacterium]|jgi:hypothetical protein|nr:hypothetical protein [Acidobacteriaceae bacterium]